MYILLDLILDADTTAPIEVLTTSSQAETTLTEEITSRSTENLTTDNSTESINTTYFNFTMQFENRTIADFNMTERNINDTFSTDNTTYSFLSTTLPTGISRVSVIFLCNCSLVMLRTNYCIQPLLIIYPLYLLQLDLYRLLG